MLPGHLSWFAFIRAVDLVRHFEKKRLNIKAVHLNSTAVCLSYSGSLGREVSLPVELAN